MEMPLRWGAEGVYQDGKSKITCQTFNIHEHSVNHLEVVQTRWHPHSPTDSHLFILLSDNSIRTYDESSLKHIWRVGPVPNYAAVEKNLSYLQSLGDTAVDFDIASADVKKEENQNDSLELDNINSSINSLSISKKVQANEQHKRIEWPIVVLRGNGSIFVLNVGLNTDKPRLQGPLTMIPSQKDNYGDDSCSLLVIPTLPPTIILAENSGVLHHGLLIKKPLEEYPFDETRISGKNDWDLFVLETIELELGLLDDKQMELSATPLTLKRDPINEQRYFCYHDTGLHGVTIGFVQQLQSYVNDASELEPNMNVKSRAEYILSTKAFLSSKINAIAGIGLLQSPSGIFAILSSGQVVSLNTIKTALTIFPELSSPMSAFNDHKSIDRKIPFDQHIKTLLYSGVTQPILKLDKTNPPSSQNAFELLMNSIQVMRENLFKRHDEVRQEIAKRAKILEFMKNQQKDEIAQLFDDKKMIQEKAYKLADMHEDIGDRQQILQKRVQDALRLASLRLPSGNSADKEFAEHVKRIKSKTEKLLLDVKQIKAKQGFQKQQFETFESSNEYSIKALPLKQEDTIKEILVDMTKHIGNLQKDVHSVISVVNV